MRESASKARLILVGLAFVAGCADNPRPPERPAVDDEAQVRDRFAELQKAVKAGDADPLWNLLSGRSQTDAEREAAAVRTAHAGANAQEKARLEKELGLDSEKAASLTGKSFLATAPFKRKYHELPDSKIEKVVVEADSATVHFLEPDGDHEKLRLVRQEGEWKVWLTTPKVKKP